MLNNSQRLAQGLIERHTGLKLPDPEEPLPIDFKTIDPIQWMQENFYVYDRAEPLRLYPCQIRPLQEAFRRDAQGNYIYNTVLWSWPKKSAKSTVVAAVVDFVCATRPRQSAKLIANDLQQADSRVGMYIRENLKANEARKGTYHINTSGYYIEYANRSRVEMVALDPRGEAGGNDDLLVYSELWGWKNKAQIHMWEEMTLSPNKYGNSQRWIDTYAGFSGDSPILEQLYNLGVKQGRRLWDDLEVYVNDEAKLLCVWVTEHLLPWQINESGLAYYAEQKKTLTTDGFKRMHLNQWVASLDAFVPPEWWEQCQGDIPDLKPFQPLVIALDAGVSSDCFGMVAVTRQRDPKTKRDMTYVRYARKWTPGANGKIDFGDPEAELIRLCTKYNVKMVMYDPFQLHDMMTRFRRRNIAACHEFSQGARREEADKHLYDMIREIEIIWSRRVAGMDDLTEHITNARQQTVASGNDSKLRLVKGSNPDNKIDLAVTLSMAAHEAKRLNLA